MSVSNRWMFGVIAVAVTLAVTASRADMPGSAIYNPRDIDLTVPRALHTANPQGMDAVASGLDLNQGFFISRADRSVYFHPGLPLQIGGMANERRSGASGPSTQVSYEGQVTPFDPAPSLAGITAGTTYFLGRADSCGHHAQLSIDVGYVPTGGVFSPSDQAMRGAFVALFQLQFSQ